MHRNKSVAVFGGPVIRNRARLCLRCVHLGRTKRSEHTQRHTPAIYSGHRRVGETDIDLAGDSDDPTTQTLRRAPEAPVHVLENDDHAPLERRVAQSQAVPNGRRTDPSPD